VEETILTESLNEKSAEPLKIYWTSLNLPSEVLLELRQVIFHSE